MSAAAPFEDLLRELAPRVLAVLVRRRGDFDACEDAVQEALLAAAVQWPGEGLPDNPGGWLVTVASRRLTEGRRREQARRRREAAAVALSPSAAPEPVPAVDDTLTLLLLCCHPSLTPVSQVALTLRAVGGLTTAEIARALLVPEATVAQRISRAKQRIKASGAEFRLPPPAERAQRVAAVLHVLYLIFNEGYTASSGPALHRVELTTEAIRLTRQLHRLLPTDGEVAGLLALLLLTDARRPARTRPDGSLVPLAEQDRGRWDTAAISEGVALITEALASAPVGPYQLQAAIAAVHDEAATAEATDWPQILGLYELLAHLAPGPMVALNRVVAVAMVRGPRAGLEELAAAEADPALAGHHRVDAVRAHLLELAGDREAARAHFRLAARRTLSIPERRYLLSKAEPTLPAVMAGPRPVGQNVGMREVRFGYFLIPNAADPLLATAREVERLGLDYIGVQDHPYQRRFVDTWTLLSMIAATTSRVVVFPDVACLPLRPPAVLAKAAASLDVLSGGRLELGLGAGSFWDAIAGYGGPRRGPGESLAALAEAVEVIRKVWSGERNLRFEGEHYRLAGVHSGPVPAHPIGIWLGVYGPRALRLAGRVADGWVPSLGDRLSPLLEGAARLDAAAAEAGRDPADIRRILNVRGVITDGASEGLLRGPAAQWVEELTTMAVEHRFDTFVFWGERPADLPRFAEEVAPAVRAQVASQAAR